jgi:uncharacterized protein
MATPPSERIVPRKKSEGRSGRCKVGGKSAFELYSDFELPTSNLPTYSGAVELLRQVLERDPRIAYAVVFGATARGGTHAGSDIDLAVGLEPGTTVTTLELGALTADLEAAAHQHVDLTVLDEAPDPLAYRVFRDGVVLVERNHRALAERKAQAILGYLDFRPLEEIAVRGVLAAAARGR